MRKLVMIVMILVLSINMTACQSNTQITETFRMTPVGTEKVIYPENAGTNKTADETETTSVSGNQNIDVTIDAIGFVDAYGKVRFEITTNLPTDMELMLTLSGYNYMGQSNVHVYNAIASSPFFSKDDFSLPAGEYNLEVYTGWASVQSDEVRLIIGNQGENLTGDLVLIDPLLGEDKVATANFSFKINMNTN